MVISRVISRVTILITHVRGLITPLITTDAPPRRWRDSNRGDLDGFNLSGMDL